VALSVAFVGTSVFVAAQNVTNLIVEPQMTELRMVRSQVAALPDGVTRVGFVQTPSNWSMSKLVVGDEFGLPTSSVALFPEPLVLLLLHEEGRLPWHAQHPVVDFLPWNTTTHPS